MADYAANISVNVKGLNKVQELEKAVEQLTVNLSKLTKVAVDPFKGQITALKTLNSLLKSNEQLLKGQASKIKAATTTKVGTTAKKVTKPEKEVDTRLFREQAELLSRTVTLIQKRNKGLSQSVDIAAKELEIRNELEKGSQANLSVVRAMIANMRQVVGEQEKLEAEAAKVTAQLDIQVSLAQSLRTVLGDAATAFVLKLGDALKLLRSAGQIAGKVGNIGQAIGNATIGEKATKDVGTRAKNIGTRGLIGAAAVGGINAAANAYAGLADSLNSAQSALADAASTRFVGGAFDALAQSLPQLDAGTAQLAENVAQLTGNWGMAAVAAMALAPQLKNAAEATYELGKAAGAASKQNLFGNLDMELPSMTAGMKALNAEMERYKDTQSSSGATIREGSQAFRDFQTQTIPAVREQMQVERAFRRSSAGKAEQREIAELLKTAAELRAKDARATQDSANASRQAAEATRQQALALQELAGQFGALIPKVDEYQRLTNSINAVTAAAANLERTRADYFGTSNRNMQIAIQKTREYTTVINELNNASRAPATVPALRPAGMTDAEVRSINENNSTFQAANKPFGPAARPGMSPVSLKEVNAQAKALANESARINSITEEIQESWRALARFAGDYRNDMKAARVQQAVATKETETSLLNSRMRLMFFERQNKELQKQKGIYALIARQIAKMMPGKGEAAFKEGKAKFLENVGLGVGFPLMFGAGPGSVIGSGIGSLFGDGFGGQIFGGAIGQILDQTVASAQALGNALGEADMSLLVEQGIALTGELQNQVRLLNQAGEFEQARDLVATEFKNQTGDIGGEQAKLAAGSVNELQKAWNGVVKALTVATGTLAAPFIQALTAVLRLVQWIVWSWNMIASAIGAALGWVTDLVGKLWGAESATQDMYEASRKNTAEYERQTAELLKQQQVLDRMVEDEAIKNAFRVDDIEARRTSGFTSDDKILNAALDYQKQRVGFVEKEFTLRKKMEREIADLREENGGKGDQAVLEQNIASIRARYKEMFEGINKDRAAAEVKYRQKQDQLEEQAARSALKRFESERKLKQQGVALERQQQDFRLNSEEAIFQMRRKATELERQQTQLKRSIEDRIFSQQQQLAEKQLSNSRQREQLAIDAADLEAQARQRFTGAPGEEIYNQVINGQRQVAKLRAEADADRRQRETKLALELAKLSREQEKYKLQVGDQLRKLQEAAADHAREAKRMELKFERGAYDLKVAAADYALEQKKKEIDLAKTPAERAMKARLAAGGSVMDEVLRRIRSGEGNYNSVNRRVAGDTPGGMPGLTEKTLGEIMGMQQRGEIFAAGAYQFIPTTLSQAIAGLGMDMGTKFSKEVQDKLAKWLILGDVKRPALSAYLTGRSDDLDAANQAAAQEWASLQGNNGRGAYDGDSAGNMASHSIRALLPMLRDELAGKTNTTKKAETPVDKAVTQANELTEQIPAAKPIDVAGTQALLNQSNEYITRMGDVLTLTNQLADETAELGISAQELANLQQFQASMVSLVQPIAQIARDQEISAQMIEREAELVAEGMLPAQVQQTIEIEKQVAAQLQKVDTAIALLENDIQTLTSKEAITKEDEKQLALLKARLGLLQGARDDITTGGQAAVQGVAEAQSPSKRMEAEVTKTKQELNKLQDPINIAVNSANELGEAFSDAFKNIVTGSMSAQEAFATMTQRMGEYFIDMAMDMLAQYVKLIMMQAIFKALGGPNLGSPAPGTVPGGPAIGGGRMPLNMASGGRPMAGQPVIVGERGPEVFTPDSAGTISSNRHFDAARDSMSQSADNYAAANSEQREEQFYEAMQSGGGEIEVRYDANIINDVRYVTEDQFQQGMKQTANNARARTMGDLRNYPRKRASIGMR